VRRLAITVAVDPAAGTHLLGAELGALLNPLTVELVRAECLPGAYSGNPAHGGPFEELAHRCRPVHISWRLPLGAGPFRSKAKPHGRSISWNEKHTVLAGDLNAEELAEALCTQPLAIQLRDRDPLVRSSSAVELDPLRSASSPADAAALASAPTAAAGAATAVDDPDADLRAPYGVGLANFSSLVTKARDGRPGIEPFASRRVTLAVQIVASKRPPAREPPDADVFPFYPIDTPPYYPGHYVEEGTCVTLRVETLLPLGARPPAPAARLQRVLVWMAYGDTSLLQQLNGLIESVNRRRGLDSPSAWQQYSSSGTEERDVITGFQLTDGLMRLFVLEGGAAQFTEGASLESDAPRPLNGMGELAVLLKAASEREAVEQRRFLINWKASFGRRLYGSFETPTKLIKLRQPLHELMCTPAPYVHGRVSVDCALALTRIYASLSCARLRDVHKYALWVPAVTLLDLEKKFGDALTVADRNGMPLADTDAASAVEDDAYHASSPLLKGSGGHEQSGRGLPRSKPPTDAAMPTSFARSLRERAARAALDYVALNARPLVCANPQRPKRTFEFDRSELAAPDGQMYVYSSQRYASAETHKRLLKAMCEEEAGRTGFLRSYNAEFLAAADIGDDDDAVSENAAAPGWRAEARALAAREPFLRAYRPGGPPSPIATS
jgi:hypothetical protein